MDDAEELRVTFNPPLYLQRQRWVLDVLRREVVQSVLDIGCGEGSLLQCLTVPPQSTIPLNLPATSPFLSGPGAEYHSDLYLKEIHGLDPYAPDLELAILATSPPKPDERPFTGHERWRTRDARWMPLEVNLWEGGFEAINDDFKGDRIDAFVASEVIEHLSPDLLPLFAPIILGYYRPRLLLLTTPNFTYNQRFSPPGEVSPTGYPDPTGRTNRVFRHHDHKFEWTTAEWSAFCTDTAGKFGYDVEVDGVGLSVQPDPWYRDEILGFATQVAVFRRLDAQQPSESAISFLKSSFANAQPPILRAKHLHLPHPLSLEELALPPIVADIHQAVKDVMKDYREGSMTFDNAWKRGTISLKCAGDLAALVQAFAPANLGEEWTILDDVKGWDGTIVWKNFVAPEDAAEPGVDTDYFQSADDSPEWYDMSANQERIPRSGVDSVPSDIGSAQTEHVGEWGTDGYSWNYVVEKGCDLWEWGTSSGDARHGADTEASSSEYQNEANILES